METGPISQRVIAEHLRLSITTVSKSFRNHPDIRPETRALVLNYAAEIGYVVSQTPRVGRRATATRQGKFVGVLFNDNPNPTADYAGIGYLAGMSEAAGLNNVSLIVHRFTGSSDRVLDPVHQPVAMRDGLLESLVLVHRVEPHVVRQLAERYPTVALTHFVHGARMDLVDSNHLGAMAGLVEHLQQGGHRQFGFLGYDRKMSFNQSRFGSFVQALSGLGLMFDPRLAINVFAETSDFDAQADAVVRHHGDGVTAWVCVSDYVGYEVMRRVIARGLRVPQDVSFTGYDAILPMYGLPPLTTVKVPFKEMGTLAIDRLQRRVSQPARPGMQSLIDCQFIPGRTTGPRR